MERREALQWGAWVLIPAMIAALAWYFTGTQRSLRLCDDAIQAQLKAPSTYSRVSHNDFGGSTMIKIIYDAENSFGVPLRSEGYCNLDDERTAASWRESGT